MLHGKRRGKTLLLARFGVHEPTCHRDASGNKVRSRSIRPRLTNKIRLSLILWSPHVYFSSHLAKPAQKELANPSWDEPSISRRPVEGSYAEKARDRRNLSANTPCTGRLGPSINPDL